MQINPLMAASDELRGGSSERSRLQDLVFRPSEIPHESGRVALSRDNRPKEDRRPHRFLFKIVHLPSTNDMHDPPATPMHSRPHLIFFFPKRAAATTDEQTVHETSRTCCRVFFLFSKASRTEDLCDIDANAWHCNNKGQHNPDKNQIMEIS